MTEEHVSINRGTHTVYKHRNCISQRFGGVMWITEGRDSHLVHKPKTPELHGPTLSPSSILNLTEHCAVSPPASVTVYVNTSNVPGSPEKLMSVLTSGSIVRGLSPSEPTATGPCNVAVPDMPEATLTTTSGSHTMLAAAEQGTTGYKRVSEIFSNNVQVGSVL